MNSDFKKYNINDSCDLLTGFPFKGEKYSSTGIRVVRGENVTIGDLRWDTIKCWNEPFVEKEKYFLREGDIIIGMDGSRVGKNRAQIKSADLPLLLAQRVTRLRAKEGFNQDYLAYVIKSDSFENYVDAIKTGTSIPHISPQQIKEFSFIAPDKQKQERIADILSSLDNKIAINRQINTILGAIAQAIFKEWFVEFRFPGATGEMVDSELGMIPKGWQVGKIKDLTLKIQYGLTKSASIENVGPHFLRITDIQSGIINWENVPYCVTDDDEFQKYRIHNYDVFVARTGASTGENVLVINPPEAVFASYLIRLQFESPQLAIYVGKLLRTNTYFEFIDSIKSGSAQPNANAQQLTDLEIVIPNDDVLHSYFKVVDDIEKIKSEFQYQSITLARLRDSLLPKLMSGEIEV